MPRETEQEKVNQKLATACTSSILHKLLPEVAHKVGKGTGARPYEDRLRKWALFSLDKRRLHRDLIATFQNLRRAHKEAVERLFKRN